MSYPESGLKSEIVRLGWRQVTKVTSTMPQVVSPVETRFARLRAVPSGACRRNPGSAREWPDSNEWTTHWLPVAVKRVPISCYRDGFPRPAIFKELRDKRRHDDGLQEYGNPRGSLF